GIQRAKIGPGSDVASLQLQTETERLDHTAADLKLERIVSKQSEVTRPAAGSDAGRDRDHATLRDAVGDERVEVGSRGGFQGRHFALDSGGNVAQSVQYDQGKLGVRFQCQFGIECVQFHVRFRVQGSNRVYPLG